MGLAQVPLDITLQQGIYRICFLSGGCLLVCRCVYCAPSLQSTRHNSFHVLLCLAAHHPKDELPGVLDELRPAAKAAGAGETADALYSYLLERVRTNLHVVLCLSPVGEAFRERCRMFPGLVNCTTIDWFTEWPADALFEVAQKQLGDVDLGSSDVRTAVCKVCPCPRYCPGEDGDVTMLRVGNGSPSGFPPILMPSPTLGYFTFHMDSAFELYLVTSLHHHLICPGLAGLCLRRVSF